VNLQRVHLRNVTTTYTFIIIIIINISVVVNIIIIIIIIIIISIGIIDADWHSLQSITTTDTVHRESWTLFVSSFDGAS